VHVGVAGVAAFLKSRRANRTPPLSRNDQTIMAVPNAATTIAIAGSGMTTATTAATIVVAISQLTVRRDSCLPACWRARSTSIRSDRASSSRLMSTPDACSARGLYGGSIP